MALNDKQLQAVNAPIGQNILISAGAGSGKTSVLTQRVIRILSNDEAQISELLILTFTNAAALEMRVRIKDALSQDPNLSHLVPLVDSCHIQTYDAYRMFIVKKYGRLIGLSNDINVLDNDIFYIKKREIINNVLQEEYKNDSSKLHDIVNNFLDRDDKDLVDFISDIIDEVPTIDDEYIEKYVSEKCSDEFFEKYKNDVYTKVQSLTDSALHLLEPYKSENKGLYDGFLTLKTEKSFDEMFLDTNPLKGKRIGGKNSIIPEEIKEEIRKYRDEIKGYYDSIDVNLLNSEDIPSHKKLIPYVLKLALKSNNALKKFKKINGFFTFNDISNFANEILEKNPDVRNSIKHSFKEIMIDEYQDTSDLDEKFISLISNDNVFCVGDIKQSIYQFRGANPINFKNKSDEYRKKDSNGTLITMNDNYRSRKEVIDFINELFQREMTNESSSISYKNNEELIASNKDFDENKAQNQRYGFFAIKYENQKENLKSKDGKNFIEEPVDVSDLENDEIASDDEDSENEKSNEDTTDYGIEARLMAEDILKRIQSKEQVTVKENGKTIQRNIQFKDFAILVEKTTKLDKIESTFAKYGIPLNIYTTENLLVSDVINTIIAFLKFVEEYQKTNPNKNILKRYFVSVSRSFIFEYDDQTIYNEIMNKSYEQDDVYQQLVNFSNENKNLLISTIYNNLLSKFNFLDKLSKFRNPLKEVNTLNLLYSKTCQLDQLHYTLSDFIQYLNDLDDLDLKIDVSKRASSDNAVQLMTIHKSKGLQFNVVYFPQLQAKGKNDKRSFVASAKEGFWLPFLSNKKRNKSLIYKFYNGTGVLEEQERIRKFYVALTRVIEVGIFLLPPKPKDTNAYTRGLARYLNDQNIDDDPFMNVEMSNERPNKEDAIDEFAKPVEPVTFKHLKVNFIEDTAKHHASKAVDDDTDENLLLFGTHMHLLMEIVDFKTKDISFIKNEKQKSIIKNVLDLPVFQNLEDTNIYKEYQFNDDENSINGVIDLMIEYNNRIVIIDYKLKNIDDDEYSKQLEVYKNYVERVFKKEAECYLLSLNDAELKRVL